MRHHSSRRTRSQRQPEMYILLAGATIVAAVTVSVSRPVVSIAILIAGFLGIIIDIIATRNKTYQSVRAKRLTKKVNKLKNSDPSEVPARLAAYCYRNRLEIERLTGFYTTEVETVLVAAPRTPARVVNDIAKSYIDWLEYEWARIDFYPIPKIDAKVMGLLIGNPKVSVEDRNDMFNILTTRDPSPVVVTAIWEGIEANPELLNGEQMSRLTVLTALG